MFTILMLAITLQKPAHITDTNMLQVMRPDEVFVRPDGNVYLLNFEERLVQHYDASGKLTRAFGGKGKGPGEFTFPSYISLMNNRIYIWDELTNLISVFDLEGRFLHHIRLPTRGLTLQRSTGGWFFFRRDLEAIQGAPTSLAWSGDGFQSQKVLAEIETSGQMEGMTVAIDDGKAAGVFSPLTVAPLLRVSPDGSRCYVAHAEKFHIDVYDGANGRHLFAITRDEKRVPFDEDWADERFEKEAKQLRKDFPGVHLKKQYPPYFPAIRALAFDPAGNLVVDRWRGKPNTHHHLVAYDAEGKEAPTSYDWTVMRRLAGVAQGDAYVVMLEEDSDAALAKVPLKQLNRFVKDHPVTDWFQDRSIFY